jgi:hypothetical protein
MEWTQELVQSLASILTSIVCMGSTFAIFLWARSESRADYRALDIKMDANRIETRALIDAIHQEMKDFHGRLCAIEERNKK